MTDVTYADKIAKLLAKAESTTPEEAELLFTKAAELMEKYAIDEAMIDAARGIERDVIVKETLKYEGTYRHATAMIGWSICRASGCRGVYYDDGQSLTYTLTIVGFQSDVNRVKLLNSSLQIQCAKAQRAWAKEGIKSWMDRGMKFKTRRDFIFGFAEGVSVKLQAAHREGRRVATAGEAERTNTTEAQASDSVQLVLRSRKERVDEWMDSEYGALRSKSVNYSRGGAGARNGGFAAGRASDVGQTSVGGRKMVGR